ncbi:phage holin [Psychrobacillus psychrodurans]
MLLGVVSDPTTDGLSDSQQAMRYHKPRDEVK